MSRSLSIPVDSQGAVTAIFDPAPSMLCFNGTCDTLCRRDLMDLVVAPLRDRWTMHWLEGAGHGFKTLQSSRRAEQGVLAEVGKAFADWSAKHLS